MLSSAKEPFSRAEVKPVPAQSSSGSFVGLAVSESKLKESARREKVYFRPKALGTLR